MAETIANLAVKIGVDLTEFENRMTRFKKSFGDLGNQVQDAGTQIGTAFTAAGGAVAVGLGFAVKTAADFESAMSRVGALSGATGEDLERLRNTAKKLGETTAFSATQAAEGMQFLAMAGYDTNEIIDAMPGLLATAAAGQLELGEAADIVSNILSGFGKQASETANVADVLTATFTSSNTNLQMLGETMKYVAPIAKSAGQSLEEMAAATGVLGNAGIQGSEAGTALRAVLIRLADPPKEAQKALEQLGVTITDSSGKIKPLSQIIGELNEATKGMSQSQKLATISTITGTEAASAMLTLMDAGQSTIEEFRTKLENSGGTAERIANQQLDNLNGSLTVLKSAVEGAMISIGEALTPAIRALADVLTRVVSWFNELPGPVKQFIAIGGALTAILLLVAGAVGFLTAGLGALAVAEWAVLAPILAIVAAVVAAIAILIALGYAVYEAYNRFEWFRNVVDMVWNAIKTAVSAAWNWIKQTITNAINHIRDTVKPILDQIKSFWNENGQQILSIAKTVWGFVWRYIKMIATNIWNAIKAAWSLIQGITKTVWNLISNIIKTAVDLFLGIVKTGLKILKGDWKGAWETLKSTAKNLLGNIIKTVKQLLGDLASTALNFGKNLMKMFADGIRNGIKWVKDAATAAVNKVKSILGFESPTKEGPGRYSDKWAPNFMKMFVEGLRAGIPDVRRVVLDVAANVNPTGAASAPVAHPAPTYNITVNARTADMDERDLMRVLRRAEMLAT